MAEKAKKLSAKVQKLVDAVKELSLMEVSELVSALEEEFGVNAAAPMMMALQPLLLRKKMNLTSSSKKLVATKLLLSRQFALSNQISV